MQLIGTKQTKRTIEEIPIHFLMQNTYGVRKKFDRGELNSLAKSIREVGIIEPVLVRKVGENLYRIVSGERRVRAGRLAGLKTIPCVCLGLSERKSALFSVVENLQQSEIDPFDEAKGIQKLVDFYGMTIDDAGLKLGVSGDEIRKKLRILRLSQDEIDFCRQLKAQKDDIYNLGQIDEQNLRLEALERIAKGELEWKDVLKIKEIVDEEDKKQNGIRKNSEVFSNKSLFFRTIGRAVEILNSAGGVAVLEKIKGENQTVILITVEN